jgi:hypothetical protein
MKKIIYGGLFLVLVGITVYSCKKEEIKSENQTSIFDRIKTDGKILIFETLKDYETVTDGETPEKLKSELIKHIQNLKFNNYFSNKENNSTIQQKDGENEIQEMDEELGQLLNEDGVVQIDNNLYKVNLGNESVFKLPAPLYGMHYTTLVAELTEGTPVKKYSIDDDVLYQKSGGCGGSSHFNEPSPIYNQGLLGGEYVQFRARYFKSGIYFCVRIKGYQYPNQFGIYGTNPSLRFEVSTTSWNAMRMRPRPCSGNNNVYHHGGMRDFTQSGVWSADGNKRYKVFKAYERARGLNGYRVWVRGYCNGNLAHTNWIGREVNSNF